MIASTENQPSFEDQAARFRALQPVYSALVREFVIEISACPVDIDDIDGDEISSLSSDLVERATVWFQQVDAQLQVHQLRQFLQTTPLASEAVLRHLLIHHMKKTAKSASDRDKTDFLLVQYFSLCTPSGLEDSDVDLNYVAQVLEPVLGPLEPELPAWLSSLETIMQSASTLPAPQRTAAQRRARARAQAENAECGALLRAFQPWWPLRASAS